MLMVKLIGIVEAVLLLVLFGLSNGTQTAWMMAILFCSILLLTCAHFASRRLQYRGWASWFLCSSTYYVLPVLALLYFAVPNANFALLAVCVCALSAERYREIRAEQSQLGWIALPIVSAAFAIWLDSSRAEYALNFLMAASAVCATALYFANVGRIGMKPSASMTRTIRAADAPRAVKSVGRAA
jgi:hypothetical protein